MSPSTAQTNDNRRVSTTPTDGRSFNPWFQLSLVWLVAGLCWQQFGLELESAFDYYLQLFIVATGAMVVVTLWVISSNWRAATKRIVISGCLVTVASIALTSVREFNASLHVLDPPRVTAVRIIHPGLRISYSRPSGYRFDLRPVITLGPGRQQETASRLLLGDSATVCSMEHEPVPSDVNWHASSITVQIQPSSAAETNLFVRSVRQIETEMSAHPSVQLLSHTRRVDIAGLEMAEFEFVVEPQHRFGRNVFLRSGGFLVTFIFQTEREQDRPVFDEFLKSIRLEHSWWQ